jgi:ubiquinone/menaquinone biosynthesis C-methylase UbiE
MRLRERLFAWMYHNLLSSNGHSDLDDPFTREVRRPLLAQAHGHVLEIGAGNGGNLPFYSPDIRLTLLDPNPFLLRHLREAAARLGRPDVAIVEAFAEDIPYPDGSFDTVVSTHVLCSVRNQGQALNEIRRVLRPSGQFLFLEHVAAPPQTPTFHAQHLINPVWRLIGNNCHLTRDTGAAIHLAGFHQVRLSDYQAGWPGIVSPHVFGSASA